MVHNIGANSAREGAETPSKTSLQYDVMLDFGIDNGRTRQRTSTATRQYNAVHQGGIKCVGTESSTTRAGEEIETHDVLSRRSLEAFAPELSTSTAGSGDATSDLAQGRERGQAILEPAARREHLGSSNEANQALLEDLDELEQTVHLSQSIFLRRLEESIQNAEFSEFLLNSRGDEQEAARGQEARQFAARESGGEDRRQDRQEHQQEGHRHDGQVAGRRHHDHDQKGCWPVDQTPGRPTIGRDHTTSTTRTAESKRTTRIRRGVSSEELSAAAIKASQPLPTRDPVQDAWERHDREVDSAKASLKETVQQVDTVRWEDHHGRSAFTGLGYGTTVKQYEASRQSVSSGSKLSGAQWRRIKRELRAVDDDNLMLGFEAFSAGAQTDSINLSEHVYSAVDSGTSVTVAKLAEQLSGFDKSATIKIAGFNGAVSRSGGKGRMIGIAKNRHGERVVIRVPDAHHVAGAPSDLLSVSGLVACGYEFHFTKAGAWIVTPEMEIIDLEQRAGLYWLKWIKTVDPLSKAKSPAAQTADAKSMLSTANHGGAESPLEQDKPVEGADQPLHGDDEADEMLNELNTVESPDIGAAQVELGWTPDARPLSATCSQPECAHCCGIVREREKYVTLDLLHRRLGHFDPKKLDNMVSQRALDVRLINHHVHSCDVCKANKLTRGAVPKQREDDAAQRKPFERVWTDVKGKLLRDLWGNEYMVTFTCEVTRWTCVYFCKRKSEVVDRFREFLSWVKRQGHVVRVLNSDGGGEYTANENAKVMSDFQRVCVAEGITQELTSPDTSAQNGISERLNRTLIEHAKTVLHEAGLARELWTLAVKHVCWIRNRLWHPALQFTAGAGISPFQALYGRTPKVSMAKVFGCDAWRLDMTVKKGSLEPKGKKGIFVGLSANRKGWLILDPKSRKCTTSFHCSFDESLEGRRCALRDFDLRQHKAGPGASKDEERLALLERELYDEGVDIPLNDDRLHGFREEVSTRENKPDEQAGPKRRQYQHMSRQQADRVQDEVESNSSDSWSIARPNSGREGNRARLQRGVSNDGSHDALLEIPKRRAAIGTKQDLNDEDMTFLEIAFVNDLPAAYQQRNPKSQTSASRVRYEKYKNARTLREAKARGATWDDIKWDYARGYIDFKHVAGFVDIVECRQRQDQRGISVSPAAAVDEKSNLFFSGHFAWPHVRRVDPARLRGDGIRAH